MINLRQILKIAVAITLTGLIIQLSISNSTAQTQPSGFLPSQSMSARTYALAEATVADFHDVTSMTLNPASLAQNLSPQTIIVTAQQNWKSNISSENISVPVFKNSIHTVAASFNSHNKGIEDLKYLTPATDNSLELDINRLQLGLGYAIALNSKLSLGSRGKLIYGWNKFQKVWAGNFDVGLLYAPTQSLSYAIALRNVGSDVKYSLDFDGTTILKDRKRSESIELGASMTFPENSDRTLFSISFGNEKVFGHDQLIYKGGVEVKPIQSLPVRVGYINGFDHTGFRFGIGFVIQQLQINYATAPSKGSIENGHYVSISVNL